MEDNFLTKLSTLSPELINSFVGDCIGFIKGGRVPFLSKYKDTLSPCDIIRTRKEVLKMIEEIIKVGHENVTSLGVPSNVLDALRLVEEHSIALSKQQMIQYTRRTLVDFNYSVKIIMGSDTSSVVKVPVVQVELFVKDINNMVERVVLELNKEELRAFIDQLVQIEKDTETYYVGKN